MRAEVEVTWETLGSTFFETGRLDSLCRLALGKDDSSFIGRVENRLRRTWERQGSVVDVADLDEFVQAIVDDEARRFRPPQFPSEGPLLDALRRVPAFERWCTPSILAIPESERIDPYNTDVSVSASEIGSLLSHTGRFKQAEREAAASHGADRTFFSVHGSTGANFTVVRMLSLIGPNAHLILARNVHHSVLNALKMCGVAFSFLPKPNYDQEFEALLPPSSNDVRQAIDELDGSARANLAAVMLTSPTYEGATADIPNIVRTINELSPNTMVIIDEAWGGHLTFCDALPASAMGSGADLAIQSTHKMAGALQQTGMLHVRLGRVPERLLDEAFREYITTSPSYHLVSSIQEATRRIAANGAARIRECIDEANRFVSELGSALPRVRQFTDVLYNYPQVTGRDSTKVTIGLTEYDDATTGIAVGDKLAKSGIIVEKAGINTLTFIRTFQLALEAVSDTVVALEDILAGHERPSGEFRQQLPDPFTLSAAPSIPMNQARRAAESAGVDEPTGTVVGRIAAESVEVYPPGIPLIIEGFVVTREALDYLRAVQERGGKVVARDPTFSTIRVFPNDYSATD